MSSSTLDLRVQDRDPFSPPPPQSPVFDRASNTWIFSRYDDVLAALCQPALRQTLHQSLGQTAEPLKGAPTRIQARIDASAAIQNLKLAEMRPLIVSAMESAIDRLHWSRAIDLVGDLIRPWSVTLLASACQADRRQTQRLASLALDVTGGPMEARNSALRASFKSAICHPAEIVRLTLRKKKADQDLERMCAEMRLPGLKPVFLGITQTLAGFLANAWLALLYHPDAMDLLRDDPALLPAAVDELLRYAGLVHRLVRHTSEPVEIAGVTVAPGQTVVLKIASANRDPAHFPSPGRLILNRPSGPREARHLALGGGPHACVAAPFVRMAAMAATGVLIQKVPGMVLTSGVEWSRGAVISFPTALPVSR